MFYQLALITNLGVITPLAAFSSFEQCLVERAKMAKTQQYSAECLPTQNPNLLQKQVHESNKSTVEIINQISKDKK